MNPSDPIVSNEFAQGNFGHKIIRVKFSVRIINTDASVSLSAGEGVGINNTTWIPNADVGFL